MQIINVSPPRGVRSPHFFFKNLGPPKNYDRVATLVVVVVVVIGKLIYQSSGVMRCIYIVCFQHTISRIHMDAHLGTP